MKFTITFKDPDGVSYAIRHAAKQQADQMKDLTTKEYDYMVESRSEVLSTALGKFIDCDEYISIEFDTNRGTATVLER